MRLILIAPVILASALALAACGGGSSSSPTPTEAITPSPTPEPVPCTESNLYAALVGSQDLGNSVYLTIGITNTLPVCTIEGAPTLNWYDAAGTKLEVPPATNVLCQPQAGDYSTCVFTGQATLPEGAPTPAPDVNGQAVAIIGVAKDASCETPAVTAHFVGLQFPGIAIDAQVELPEDVSVSTCEGQVTLQGYGPLPVPQE